MAAAVPSDGRSQPEETSARDSSRIHQRRCERCHRWFWAWHPDRHRCYVCDPLPTAELRAVLEDIDRCAV
jgi:hypothetical protein